MNTPLSPDDLEARLRAVGDERYHIHHPFHKLLHAGDLNRAQVQAWALNRYCYQRIIPIKDAALIARTDDPALRRAWRKRLADHDGSEAGEGGIERWVRLATGVGLDRDYVESREGALPATEFAVQAYVHYVSEETLLKAVASSLTEMFAPTVISERVSGMLANYDFVTEDTLAYFTPRLTQAPEDADFALAYVKEHATTVEEQQDVIAALKFKCDVLWSQLDALYHAYVDPGHIPPGAFDPETHAVAATA